MNPGQKNTCQAPSIRLWCESQTGKVDCVKNHRIKGWDKQAMLRERYAAQNIFEEIGTVSIAMEPVLMELDRLLDDDVLFEIVKGNLSQRYARTLVMGRRSTPVEVILRMLIVKHLYGWSYEQTEQWVSDSLVLRQFCRVYLEKVPDDTTLLRWANVIAPGTLQAVLEHVDHFAPVRPVGPRPRL